MKKRLYWPAVLLPCVLFCAFMLWVMGCSDSKSPVDPNGDVTDTTPPEISSITPQSENIIELVFSEPVDGVSAQHRNNYEVIRTPVPDGDGADSQKVPTAEGDTLRVGSAALLEDGITVLLSVYPFMEDGVSYQCITKNIKDQHGNTMPAPDTEDFVGVDTPDDTAPEILSCSPASGATGVGIGQSVVVTFTEPLTWESAMHAFYWIGPGAVSIPYDTDEGEGDNVFIYSPLSLLDYSTQYTVGFDANTAMDYSSNYLAATSWSFTTTNVVDNTPPVIVSTSPADGTANVPLDFTLKINFSEPMDPHYLDDDNIYMNPDPGEGSSTWTNGDKTFVYDADTPLFEDTAYHLSIAAGTFRNQAGLLLSGNYSVTFTTGAAFSTGGFSGTLTGDPTSEASTDPAGAVVYAFMVNIATWDGDEDEDESPPLGGSAIADQNGDYTIAHLEDGTYWPVTLLEADGDGSLDFDYGDAVGAYGVDFPLTGPIELDSVIISGGNFVSGVDIELWDQSAIFGTISYEGSIYAGNPQDYDCYVALYDTTLFDINTSDPVYVSENRNVEYENDFLFTELDDQVEEGTYYIVAYMDIDPGDGGCNPILDPVGFHGNGGVRHFMHSPGLTPVTLTLGRDFMDIHISMADPPEDTTPPEIISTTPADGATNVPVDVILQLDFSEPIDPNSMNDYSITVTPSPGDGVDSWTNGATTLRFDPNDPLLANQVYYIFIGEGAFRDFAGNPNDNIYAITFTTAASLPTGGFSGTITGDPASPPAADPEGAVVAAFKVNFFDWNWDHGPAPIAGVGFADHNGNYEIGLLEDHFYWTLSILDADGDGIVNTEFGDAIGTYGVDFETLTGDIEPDSVEVLGGAIVPNIDFSLWDQSAIWGGVSYVGTMYQGTLDQYDYNVVLFDTTGFDPVTSTPVLGLDGGNIAWNPYFIINELRTDLVDGTYYIGAYMEIDPFGNPGYTPSQDPAAIYEVGGEYAVIDIKNGEDFGNIIIELDDVSGPGTPPVLGVHAWHTKQAPLTRQQAILRQLSKAIQDAVSQAKHQKKTH